MSRRRTLPILFCLAAAGLLLAGAQLPLWHLSMDAPQYQGEDALAVTVHPGGMTGDLEEIRILNQYIGVTAPTELPQFKWLPIALLAGGLFALAIIALPERPRAWAAGGGAALVAAALLSAAVQAQLQMRDIGHNREQKTALAGVQNFTPPILGRIKVANFHLTSRLGLGSYLIGGAIALQLTVAALGIRKASKHGRRCGSGAPEASEAAGRREVAA
jgi:hypothetical protein